MSRWLIRLATILLLLGLHASEARAQFRRGGWSKDPVWRRREVMGLTTVLAVAIFAYGANRILNSTRQRNPSHFLDESPSPPEQVEDYLHHLEPTKPGSLPPDCQE